jgi:phosphoketolase
MPYPTPLNPGPATVETDVRGPLDDVELARIAVYCLDDRDRVHLVMDVIDRVPSLQGRTAHLRQEMVDARARARAYSREHGEDPAEISGWTWPF